MADTSYADLADLKARLDISDADHDAELTAVLASASRMVDGWCNRSFGIVEESRVATARTPRQVYLAMDLINVSEVATDLDADGTHEITWDGGDYALGPGYAPPYQLVYARATNVFPLDVQGVRITGTWGYGVDVPMAINEATLLQAARLYKRKDAPFGIAGNAELGTLQVIGQIDPDVKQLIQPYKRPILAV